MKTLKRFVMLTTVLLLTHAPAAHATLYLADLTDGQWQWSTWSGYFSLRVQPGDRVTVSVINQGDTDLWAAAWDKNPLGPDSKRVATGDNELPPSQSSPFGDPQLRFVANSLAIDPSECYVVYVGMVGSQERYDPLNYLVRAEIVSSTPLPVPDTIMLLLAAGFCLAAIRRYSKPHTTPLAP